MERNTLIIIAITMVLIFVTSMIFLNRAQTKIIEGCENENKCEEYFCLEDSWVTKGIVPSDKAYKLCIIQLGMGDI